MPSRREMLYRAESVSQGSNVIPATVKFRHNKKKRIIEPLSAEEKMICALRKVLTDMSDKNGRCRYYIADNKIKLIEPPVTTQNRPGEARSYKAVGRCKIRVCHPEGHTSSMMVQFTISYRDVEDELGLADVVYFEPTTIDTISKTTAIA